MLKQRRYGLLAALTVAISIFMVACGGSTTTTGTTPAASGGIGTPGTYTCITGNLVVSGSTALQPLVTKVAKDYTTKCSGANITVQGGGSGTGRSQVEAGSVGIGNSDTPAAANQSDLVDHQVAVVIFGLIVNADAGVTSLTTAQIQGIYAGTYTNWSQVGGASQAIVVVSRPASSGTRATFAQYVLGKGETVSGPSHLTNDSTGIVVSEVGQTPGAIGYAATGQVPSGGAAKVISVDGVAPTNANVENNTYKFWNIEHMYTKGAPTQIEQALLDYMDSAQGHTDETTLGFISLTAVPAASISAHNAVPKPAS